MIRQILNSWRENRGNLLVLLGLLAGLLMCLIWYFQLVPDVALLNRRVPGTLVSTASRPNSSSLVAIVRSPLRKTLHTRAGQASSWSEVPQAIVEVYAPHDPLPPQAAPLLIQSVSLRGDGVPVAVVFSDLQPGRYAAVAYIDVNDSGALDTYQADGETIAEPFCVARLLGPARDSAAEQVEPAPRQASKRSAAVADAAPLSSKDPLPDPPAATAKLSDKATDKTETATDKAAEPLPLGVFEVTAGQATVIVLDFDVLD